MNLYTTIQNEKGILCWKQFQPFLLSHFNLFQNDIFFFIKEHDSFYNKIFCKFGIGYIAKQYMIEIK